MKENVRLLRKDIMLRELDKNTILSERTLIKVYGEDKTAQDKKIRYYTVLEAGPKCKDVKKGDIIALSWLDTMPSFEFNGERVTLTDETRVVGICEL